MNELIIQLLALLGGLFLIGAVFFLLVILFELIRTWISDARYAYRLKHRFDKPPVAKCYCKDCIYRDDNICTKADKWVADVHFCWAAIPLKKEENKQ